MAESPGGAGLVTALAVSRLDTAHSVLWALARRLDASGFVILNSIDDGESWTTFSIPTSVDGHGVVQTLGSDSVSRGDLFSLGAFGQTAVLVFKPFPPEDALSNKSVLLYFNRLSGSFSTQVLSDANDGTGLGGRRSFRSVPVHPPFEVGNGTRLLFNAGQDIVEGTGLDTEGHVQWKVVAQAQCADCGSGRDEIHSDLWDVLPSEVDDGMWIASDGGVYRKRDGFHSFNDGLHTQHIHSIAALGRGVPPRLVYATMDNDSWYRNEAAPSPEWRTYKTLGDVSWVAGDQGNPALAIAVRHQTYTTITDFDQGAPAGSQHVGGSLVAIQCTRGKDADGNEACIGGIAPTEWQVVQTGRGDHVEELMDVVWLAHRPLSFRDGSDYVDLSSGSLANELQSVAGPRVLLRNSAFAKNPDINESHFDGWSLESDNLPAGATRVWVSGGHGYDAATYYVCACSVDPVRLFKQTQRKAAWNEIIPVVLENGKPTRLDILRPETETIRGPLFVDGVYPDHLAIATTEGPVWSFDGGSSFHLDTILRALLTNSGQYPLANHFPAGNGADVVHNGRGAEQMYLGDVAFGDDGKLAVSSPFTGVFYKGPGLTNFWRNPREAFPSPLATVSSIAYSEDDVYVATEGRSLLRLEGAGDAPLASYFEWHRSVPTGVKAVVRIDLMRSDGTALSGVPVTGWRIASTGEGSILSVVTDSAGNLIFGADVKAGDRLYLEFEGTSDIAPARTGGRY